MGSNQRSLGAAHLVKLRPVQDHLARLQESGVQPDRVQSAGAPACHPRHLHEPRMPSLAFTHQDIWYVTCEAA